MRFRYNRPLLHTKEYKTDWDKICHSLYTEIRFKRFRTKEIRLYLSNNYLREKTIID